MVSTSKGWMLVAAILGGLFILAALLTLLVSALAPRGFQLLNDSFERSHRLIAAPVGPFHVPFGYVPARGTLDPALDLNGRPYQMLSTTGGSPDVMVLAAFQNRTVTFAQAWLAFRVPCDPYGDVQKHKRQAGAHVYTVEVQQCFEGTLERRVEFTAFGEPQGTEMALAWGTAFEWREQAFTQLLASLQP